MRAKLKRAVKANCWRDSRGWMADDLNYIQPHDVQPCYIVPVAEYERLAKVDKLAGKLMQHANCLLKRNKCTEYEPIVLKLMELASEPTARKK